MEKMSIKSTSTGQMFITLLRITCFFVFAGRAYQHLVWDAPFRSLLWDQEWMQGIVQSFTSMSWEEYTSSMKVDSFIQALIRATGWLYAIAAVLSLFIRRNMKWAGYILLAGSAALGFLGFLEFKEKFFQYGQLMEFGIQVITPMLLYLTLFTKIRERNLMLTAKIATAITFLGHGLYAWGYYPQPGHFIDMFINVLGFSEEFSRTSLMIAAALDFAVAILIFVPRASRPALLYCVLWGGLTAMARIMSGFDSNFIAQTLNQYTFEVLFRLSHALIPLWIFYSEGGRLRFKKPVKTKINTPVSPATANYK